MTDAVPLLRIRAATVVKGTERRRAILDGLSLEISQGQHTAILGPNGSGKSSLIKLITQEYRSLARPADGAPVQIFGRDRWNVFELRRMIGVVSPDMHRVLEGEVAGRALRGLEVVASGFFAERGIHARRQVTETMWTRSREALALMEALHLADRLMPEMSTGEARRVLIARALAPDPPALLLDEPTTGLDPVASHHFMQVLRGLAAHGKTFIFVTHHLHEIVPEVQRVVLLRDGCVYLDGPKHEMLTDRNLSGAFGAAVRVCAAEGGYYAMSLSPDTVHASLPPLNRDRPQDPGAP